MTSEELVDPNKNEYFRALLNRYDFDWKSAEIRPFVNPESNITVGSLFIRDKSDLVLILQPDMGTSVLEHGGIVREEVHYLGSIVSLKSPVLKYKFQNDWGADRNPKNDLVEDIVLGEAFLTIAIGAGRPGLYHGYHNSDKVNQSH